MSGVDDVDPWPPYPAPSEESEATSDSGFRMLRLERQLEVQRRQMETYQQQHASILTAITELTAKMSVSVQQNANAIANAVATPVYSFPPPPPPVPQRSRPKVATPETFDGDRLKGRAFLTSCQLYFTLRRSEFRDNEEKIRWILSYMKSGCAAVFAQRLLRTKTELGTFPFPSLRAFLKHFDEEFCPENERAVALTTLVSGGYYQGRKSVNEYIDNFKELINLARASDAAVNVMTFRKGLDPTIEKDIAVSQYPIPLAALQAWYERSRRYDMSRRTHDAFVGGHTRPVGPSMPTRSFFNKLPVPSHGASGPPPPPQRFDATRPRPATNIPDGRHQHKSDDNCELCGLPGHKGRNCFVHRRVRAMATEDRNEWVSNFLAGLDAADPEDPMTPPSVAPSVSSSVVDEEVTLPSRSDFVSRSE